MKIADGHYKCDECEKELKHPEPVKAKGGQHFCEECFTPDPDAEDAPAPTSGMKATLDEVMKRAAERSAAPRPQCETTNCEGEAVHGVYCAECQGKMRADHEREELKKRRAKEVDEAVATRIGRDYVRCTFENLEIDAPTKDRIYAALRGRRSVLLTGENGVGKTHCLTAIFRGLFLTGEKVAVYSAGELLDILRERTGQDYSSRKVVGEMRQVDWLLIDDLGEERLTDVVLEAFTRVIDWRSRDASPVVVTTNLTMTQIGEFYSHRIQSRIAGLVGDGAGIKFKGKDRRVAKLREGARRA